MCLRVEQQVSSPCGCSGQSIVATHIAHATISISVDRYPNVVHSDAPIHRIRGSHDTAPQQLVLFDEIYTFAHGQGSIITPWQRGYCRCTYAYNQCAESGISVSPACVQASHKSPTKQNWCNGMDLVEPIIEDANDGLDRGQQRQPETCW